MNGVSRKAVGTNEEWFGAWAEFSETHTPAARAACLFRWPM